METLVILAIVGAVAWFFFGGAYKTAVQDPETLRDEELEAAYVELKKKILVTSAYDDEQAYMRIYARMKGVLGRIIERHKHFVLDVEATDSDICRLLRIEEHHDSDGLSYREYAVPHNTDLSGTSPEVLLYLCFFLWLGGQAKGVGSITDDPDMMLKILDHLIEDRDYIPAIFFKGMVMKYGVRVYEKGNSSEARALLEEAHKRGVGAAALELLHLSKHSQLDGMPTVHLAVR